MKDLDDGFTRIANEVLQDLAHCSDFNARARVVIAVIRNTWGRRNSPKTWTLTASYLAGATGLTIRSIERALSELQQSNILMREGSKTGFNKHWREVDSKEPSAEQLSMFEIGEDEDGSPRQSCRYHDKADTVKPVGQIPSKLSVLPRQSCHTKKERGNKKEEKILSRAREAARSMPADFSLTDSMGEFAGERGMQTETIEAEFLSFKNHHEAKGSKFKSWEAAWRTWVLNWQRFGSKQFNPQQDTRPGKFLSSLDGDGQARYRETPAIREQAEKLEKALRDLGITGDQGHTPVMASELLSQFEADQATNPRYCEDTPRGWEMRFNQWAQTKMAWARKNIKMLKGE